MVQDSKVSSGRGVDCESYALSPMQQGMLFHSLEPGATGVDVEQVVCELHERIDPAHLQQAWREVVARHPILRTSFHWDNGAAPQQVVHAAAEIFLGFRAEEFGTVTEAQHRLQAYLEADRREGFVVAQAPLLRVALIRGGAATWMVTTFHHLLLDGRAMVVMFREAFELHDALVAGHRLELPAAPSYRAYIEWLQRQDWTRAEKFWRRQLQGFTAPTTLPLARATGEALGDVAPRGELAFQLPASRTAELRAAARRHEVTLNTLLQATWANVLSRYAGEEDVVFGAVRACRHIAVDGAGSIVGLMINTVPVRVRVDPQADLGAWLQALREQWVELRDHEHTPLMQLQQWSEIAPGRPLFEALFNYQEPSWDGALRALGGAWRDRHFDICSQPNYPLALDACGADTLIVKLLFDRRRLADDAMARLLGHFRTVLEAFADATVQTVGELPLLPATERRRILVEWNQTAMDYPRHTCVHAFVEGRVEQFPERCAVSDRNTLLTYRELNSRANQLAHRLVTLGVAPEIPVAVCMERSVEMIVAWLAVVKAGGAFVPLDPAYPKDRLAFQLGDCGAAVVLTQPQVRGLLPAIPESVAVLELAPDGSGFENESSRNLAQRASRTNLAYIIYTSGSTGQPKGVQIEHGALMNLVTWHQRTYAVTAEDRATHLASPAFDASIWEIWPYLAAGASVHIPADETRVTPDELVRWLTENEITISFLPTPLAEAALAAHWPREMTLRVLLTGGDKLTRRPPANFCCALVNHYGPTESTVVTTAGTVAREATPSTPTIGRPIANTRVYVLDAALRPVPAGVAGELFIGGEGLARGYLNRPELTAEKFITDPFARENDPQRLYRTGDLVRWEDNGEIEYLGRIDGQVKIRGCRIELGEIEATLQRHPAARQSLVVARTDPRGQPQLVAYVLRQSEAPVATTAELTAFLRGTLPAYMTPAAIVFMDAWPLTANGKIDRKALPAPFEGLAESEATAAGPRTGIEQTIARTWADVLGRATVGVGDDFFEIGGHSLLAAQVISRLNDVLGATLSVRSLFDHPTVGELAREIEANRGQNQAPRISPNRLKRRQPRADLELVPPN